MSIEVNGYLNWVAESQSGNLVCRMKDESRPKERFLLLEDPSDARVLKRGTKIKGGQFEYVVDPETGEPREAEEYDTEGGRLLFHVGYLTGAESVQKGDGRRGRLASMLRERYGNDVYKDEDSD